MVAMSEPIRAARPSQVTLAVWAIMVGSLLVVVTAFETISGLRSLEMRETLQDLLSTPPLDGLGLDVPGAQQVMRVASMVGAGSATMAGLLGYQLLQRDKVARVVVTLLALPIFVAGLVTGPFISSLVVVAITMLWLHPARSWFEGTWRPDPPSPEPALPPLPAPGADFTSTPGQAPGPPPAGPWHPGPPPVSPMPGVPDAWEPAPYRLAGPHPQRPTRHRPRPNSVAWAVAITWFYATMVLILSVLSVALVLSDPTFLLDELRRQNPELAAGVAQEDLVRTTLVTGGVLIVWSVAVGVLATLTYQRVAWGRTVLMVVLGATGGILIVGAALGQFLLVVPLLGVAVVYSLLVRPDARGWYRRA
jgi:hypothetical protein